MFNVRDLTHLIWCESWVKIYPQLEEDKVLYEGYMSDVPEDLYNKKVCCIVPCNDYMPFIGIELF